MNTSHRFAKPVSYVVAASMLALSLHLPVANAALVSTESAIGTTPTQQENNRIQDTLNREDVKAKLLSLGVDPVQVQSRVDALTESEVQTLAQQMDQLPAGGDLVTILLVVLLLILIF